MRAALDAASRRPAPPARTSSSTPTCRARRRATCSRSRAPSPTAVSRSSRRPTGRRTRSRSPTPGLFAPLYGPGQRRARFAALGAVATCSTRRISSMTSTRSTISRGSTPGSARTPGSVLAVAARERRVKVAVLSGGVGGARFLRGAARCRRTRQRLHHRQRRRTTSRCSACTSRPTWTASSTRSPASSDDERGWGRAGETWNALETAAALGGESWFRLGDRDIGLHLVRTELLRSGVPLSAVTERLAARARARARASARDRRPPAHVPRDAGRDVPVPGRGSSPAATGTRSTPCTTRARPTRAPAPGVLEALDGRRRDPHRAEQPVRLHRADPRGRRDPAPRSSSAASRASPSARSIGGRAVKGPGRPDARAARRRHVACARRFVLRGPDRRARGRRGRRCGRRRCRRLCAGRHADADADGERRAAGSPTRRSTLPGRSREGRDPRRHGQLRPRARDAARRARRGRGRDRLARRGARAGGRGRSSAARRGRDERGRRARRRPRRPRRQGRRGARHRRARSPARSARRRCSGRERARVLEGIGVRPDPDARSASPSGSGRRRRARSPPGSTRSPPRTSTRRRPTRTPSSAATTPTRRSLRSSSPASSSAGRALDAGPLASARALEGLTAVIVNLNRRYKAHAGIRITGVVRA